MALNEAEMNALLDSVSDGRVDSTGAENPRLAATYAAYQKLENLFCLLRNCSSNPSEDHDPLSTLTHIDRFRVQRVLGSGGFATVYLAFDPELERSVAIKVPRPDKFSSTEEASRFLREAKLTAGLSHPGIVKVFDVKAAGDQVFIVMEYVEGRTMESWLAELTEVRKSRGIWPLPSHEQIVWFFAQLADALHYAHGKGFIHRDLKPSNVLIDERGNPHIADFGLAISVHKLRKVGNQIAGTPAYMSPEQVLGEIENLNARTDIWSLGVMLYELLSGHRPFSDTPMETCFAEIREQTPSPIDCGELEEICRKAISKDPNNRFRTAGEMADRLRLSKRTVATKPKVPGWILSLSAVAILAISVYGGVSALKNDAIPDVVERRSIPPLEITSPQTEIPSAKTASPIQPTSSRAAPLEKEPVVVTSTPQVQPTTEPAVTSPILANTKWALSQTLTGSYSHVYSADVSGDGTKVVSGGADQYLRIWDAKSGQIVREIRRQDSEVGETKFLNDGKHVICSVVRHRRVEIWRVDGEKPEAQFDNPNADLWSAVLSHDEQILVTSGGDGIVTVWSVGTGERLRQLKHGLSGGIHVWLNSAATQAACLNGSSQLAVCDVTTGTQTHLLTASEGGTSRAAFSPTGQILASAVGNGAITLWNLEDAEKVAELPGQFGGMRSLSFSGQGDYLASASDDGRVLIWSMQTHEPVASLGGHQGQPAGVSFGQDGITVVSWGDNKLIKLWSVVPNRATEHH